MDGQARKEHGVTAAQIEPLTMSIPKAARLLGISRSGAYNLARRDELPGAIKLGGRILVSRLKLERAINGEEATAP